MGELIMNRRTTFEVVEKVTCDSIDGRCQPLRTFTHNISKKNRAAYPMAQAIPLYLGLGGGFKFINHSTSRVYIVIHYLNGSRYTIFGTNLFTQ